MSKTPEELMALADGELFGEEAARMEAAIAADPALAKRLASERALRVALRDHLDPVTQEPVPDALTDLIARAAAEDSERSMSDKGRATPAQIIDLTATRAQREEAEKARKRAAKGPRVPLFADRRMGLAIAASLVLGLVVGTQMNSEGPIRQTSAGLVASGSLARTLDGRLASDGDSGGSRILASFRRKGGDYCRIFAGAATSGIACRQDGAWLLERTMGGTGTQSSEYRQAGSVQGDLMAAAQDMMSGDPLNEAQEHAVIERGWR